VFVRLNDDKGGTIEEVLYPSKQMVANRQPCRTLVPLDDAQDFILGQVEVASFTSGLEGYHE
jgi:hypothetical protein